MKTVAETLAHSSAAFGTSGLRGLVDDLTPEIVDAVVQGFLQLFEQARPQKILLAHDLRPSSPDLAAMVTSSLQALGVEAVFAGAVPTPALALAARTRGLACIMVTGSHIPFDRNGIKFYTLFGEATKADEQAILAAKVSPYEEVGARTKRTLSSVDPSIEAEYRARYVAAFPDILEGWRIGVYQHSAVGRDLSVNLFEALGAEVIALERSDSFVPVDTEAVSDEDLVQCSQWCKQHGLDAVFSTDGDGDRPLLADENGLYFRGDVLGIVTAHFLKCSHVTTPVSSNTALEKSEWFSAINRTKIGSPHVLSAMAGHEAQYPNAAIAGFEANGGFLLQTDVKLGDKRLSALPTRDAILPALATIAFARKNNIRLSGVLDQLPKRFTVSGRLQNRPTQTSLDFVAKLAKDQSGQGDLLQRFGQVSSADTTDGLRMTTEKDEIVHLRPSGNAPQFRIYVEAGTAERADEVLKVMLDVLAQKLPAQPC